MGTKYIPDYINRVQTVLHLDRSQTLSDAEINDIVQQAIDSYSADSPRLLVQRYTGDGSHRYALPNSWEEGFSRISYIEYPDREQVPIFLKPNSYRILDDGDGKKIHLTTVNPSSSDNFTVQYTARHTVTSTTSTIPDADFEAVAALAACYCCIAVAATLLRNRDARLDADVVNFRTLSDEYKSMAKEFYAVYRTKMGMPEKGPKATCLVGDIDLTPLPPGVPYLTRWGTR